MRILFILSILAGLSLSSCIPSVPVLIKSDQSDVSFYVKPLDKNAVSILAPKELGEPNEKGEYFIGKGNSVKTRFYQLAASDKHLGRILLIGKKDGFTDSQVLIQPNKENNFTGGIHFFIWTIGWIALDPLWAYWTNHDSWYYDKEENKPYIETELTFNPKAEK